MGNNSLRPIPPLHMIVSLKIASSSWFCSRSLCVWKVVGGQVYGIRIGTSFQLLAYLVCWVTSSDRTDYNSFFCFVLFCVFSSTYDNICTSLERFERRRCPRSLRQHGLQCHCPFQAGYFSVQDLPLNVPKVHGYAGSLLNVSCASASPFL